MEARIRRFANSRLIQHNLIGLLVNTIQFYTVEPLWGSPDEMGCVFPGLHLRLIRGYSYYAQRGMLLICATGGINNLPFQGVIQFVVIHQGVAFGLKFSNISLILRLRASATSFKKEDSPCSAFCYKIRLFCQLQKNIYF